MAGEDTLTGFVSQLILIGMEPASRFWWALSLCFFNLVLHCQCGHSYFGIHQNQSKRHQQHTAENESKKKNLNIPSQNVFQAEQIPHHVVSALHFNLGGPSWSERGKILHMQPFSCMHLNAVNIPVRTYLFLVEWTSSCSLLLQDIASSSATWKGSTRHCISLCIIMICVHCKQVIRSQEFEKERKKSNGFHFPVLKRSHKSASPYFVNITVSFKVSFHAFKPPHYWTDETKYIPSQVAMELSWQSIC